MRYCTNVSEYPETWVDPDGNSYVILPGTSYLPGPESVVYVDGAGIISVTYPQYVESFSLGMLTSLPFVAVLVIRRILRLLKSPTLDRFS